MRHASDAVPSATVVLSSRRITTHALLLLLLLLLLVPLHRLLPTLLMRLLLLLLMLLRPGSIQRVRILSAGMAELAMVAVANDALLSQCGI
jgi:hypothetical protein